MNLTVKQDTDTIKKIKKLLNYVSYKYRQKSSKSTSKTNPAISKIIKEQPNFKMRKKKIWRDISLKKKYKYLISLIKYAHIH